MQSQRMVLKSICLNKVIVATSFYQRLRGWYGYHATQVDGVLITKCNAVHTFAMQMRLDIIWLDQAYTCIRVELDVPPWRVKWCRAARHVLELPSWQRSAGRRSPSNLIGQSLLRFSTRE